MPSLIVVVVVSAVFVCDWLWAGGSVAAVFPLESGLGAVWMFVCAVILCSRPASHSVVLVGGECK